MAHPLLTKVLTVHVPLPLADKVDQLAVDLERSRGWIIKQALTAWIDQEEERDRLTRKALADEIGGQYIHLIIEIELKSEIGGQYIHLIVEIGNLSRNREIRGQYIHLLVA